MGSKFSIQDDNTILHVFASTVREAVEKVLRLSHSDLAIVSIEKKVGYSIVTIQNGWTLHVCEIGL